MVEKVYVPPTTYVRNGKVIHRKGYWRKVTRKQRKAAKKNIKEAIKASKRISRKEHRKTLVDGVVRIPEDKYLYLDRTVPDKPPKGYSHLSEIKGTLKQIQLEVGAGVISRKTANARLMRLKAIIEQTKQGELAKMSVKKKAIQALNATRVALGFNPVDSKIEPPRPTPAQIRAAKKNIKKALKVWMSMTPHQRKIRMPNRKQIEVV